MRKRVLVAWEIGGGQGHRLQARWIGAALRRRGFEPVYALHNPAAHPEPEGIPAAEVHPAPHWPRAADRGDRQLHPSTSHADTLTKQGIEEAGAVAHMLAGWDRLFSLVKPDAIVADAAPASLMAARGRIPSVATGNCFSLPASNLDRFPDIDPGGERTRADQDAMLVAVNDGLRASGRAPIGRLGELYAADRSCVGAFDELDPYREYRGGPNAAPWLPSWQEAKAGREEVFAYFSIRTKVRRTVLNALAATAAGGMRVRYHGPNLDPQIAKWLTENRVRVEPEPLPLGDIQARARLIVSLGSLGLVSFALAAGIPQLVIPWSLPTRATGRVVDQLGTGRSIQLRSGNPLEPAMLRQAIREAYYDDALTKRAIDLAPDFRRRIEPPAAETVASLVAELL